MRRGTAGGARPPGAEKCLRLLRGDDAFLARFQISKASRFGPDGKPRPDAIFVEVPSAEAARRLPALYPPNVGKKLVPIISGSQIATKEETVLVSGRVKPIISDDLSLKPAPDKVRVIAATRRKDGTLRKEVKVRAGFRSEELDITTYKSREAQAEADRKRRAENYIPGAPAHLQPNQKKKSAGEIRAEKRRLQRAKKRAEKGKSASQGPAAGPEKTRPAKTSEQTEAKAEVAVNPADALKKRLRTVTKKLRQIEQIKAKMTSGDQINEAQKSKIKGETLLIEEMKKLKIDLGMAS